MTKWSGIILPHYNQEYEVCGKKPFEHLQAQIGDSNYNYIGNHMISNAIWNELA